jgi:hypothetical protein
MELGEALHFLSDYVSRAHPAADTALLCGSTVTGRATPASDLDLVLIFPSLPDGAFRETVEVDGQLIEAFAHDLETLDYFFRQFDLPTGAPILANMVADGVPVPGLPGLLLKDSKRLASEVLAAGPPPWDPAELDRHRYTLSNIAEDLQPGLSPAARLAVAAELWTRLAVFSLRASGHFTGVGKGLARAFEQHDPALAASVAAAISDAIATGRTDGVERAVDAVLAPYGGRLVAGYRSTAPAHWRTSRR